MSKKSIIKKPIITKKYTASKLSDSGLEFDIQKTGELVLNQPESQDDLNLLEREQGDDDDDFEDDDSKDNNDEQDNDEENEEEIEDADDKEDVEDNDNAEADNTGDDTGCLYDFTKHKTKNKIDEPDDIISEDAAYDDDNEIYNIVVKNDDRITKPHLFIYERVRLLGVRARQLLGGAKPMIKNVENMNPRDIAELELTHGVIPLKIKRQLPNGKIELWKVSELKIIN